MLRRAHSLGGWIAIGALIAFPLTSQATPEEDLAELQRQIEQIRSEYGERIRKLEERVEEAETAARVAESRAASAERALGEAAAASPAGTQAPNIFNPAISLVAQGRYAAFSGEEGEREIPGFLLGEETGRGPEGFALGESELVLSANVDDLFYGFFNLALGQDGDEFEAEVEEAYFETLALPQGFTLRGGQFFSAIGYQNARHSHTWDFIDQPLAYEALLGNQFLDPGARLSWVAPTDFYLELGAEAFTGNRYPAAGAANGGVGVATAFAKAGGDIGASNSWQSGIAYMMADPRNRESGGFGAGPLHFSGDVDLVVADFVWKWAPNGNFRQRNFVFQTEYLHRHENGSLLLDDPGGPMLGSYDGDQDGFYVQGVYQFIPRWRVGLRYGQVFSDNDVSGLPTTTLDRDDRSPWRISTMIDFSNSEFSRFRLQYSHEGTGLGNDELIFLQYIMSLGSHGAHQY
jgi:hypothetical protein